MTWENVFNTRVGETWWGHIDKARKAAKDSGYQYFTWNDSIIDVAKGDTGLKVDSLIVDEQVTIDKCISILKGKGYKIMKPTQAFEEI